jgi:hypothetical protein
MVVMYQVLGVHRHQELIDELSVQATHQHSANQWFEQLHTTWVHPRSSYVLKMAYEIIPSLPFLDVLGPTKPTSPRMMRPARTTTVATGLKAMKSSLKLGKRS